MWLIPELYERGWEYSKYRAEEEFRKDVVINDIKYRLLADVQIDEEFFGIYLYEYDKEMPEEINGGTQITLMTGEIMEDEVNSDTDICHIKLHFQPEFYTLLTEELQEETRLVYAEAFQYNMPDIIDGGILEIPVGYEIPVVQQYKALFTAYMTVEGMDEDEAKEAAWDIFRDGGWPTSWLEIKQEDPGTEDWRTPILNDSQLDILLEVLDDHRYAVIDTLKDEHMGMDEQFETRKHIDEVDKLIERLKEARA